MRPVKQLPSQTPSTAEIQFSDFDFQQLFISNHPGTSAMEGEPTKGFRFFVEAKLYGEEAGTTYHFTAEYIPDYVIQNEKKTKFCIWRQQYKYSPELQAAWEAVVASKAPTKYTLNINNTDFGGEIEGLHSQRTLFQSFVSEGAQDCGEQPTLRF